MQNRVLISTDMTAAKIVRVINKLQKETSSFTLKQIEKETHLDHVDLKTICQVLFLVMEKKRHDSKDNVNFKIHDVPTWKTNNCNIHIAQYVKK